MGALCGLGPSSSMVSGKGEKNFESSSSACSVVGCRRPICSGELWNLSKRCVISGFQVLRGLPNVVVILKELVPVLLLLLSDGIVILLRGSFCQVLELGYPPSYATCSNEEFRGNGRGAHSTPTGA